MKTSSALKIVVVCLVLMAVVLAACAAPEPAPTPTPTPEKKTVTVTIGALFDMSGPTASGTAPAVAPFYDIIDYGNKQGGLDWSGGKLLIEVDTVDHRYDPAISYPAYDKMAAKGYPLILTHASFDNVGLLDKAARDKIVLLTTSATSAALYEPGWVFTYVPSYADNFAGFLDWVKETWEGPQPAKIASLTWDNPWGKAHLCAVDYVKEVGLEYVGTEYCATAPTDVTPQLARLAKAGADYVWNQSTAPVPTILKDMYRTNFPGTFVASNNTPIDQYIAVVGGEVAAGVIHPSSTIKYMAEPDSEAWAYLQKVQLEVKGHTMDIKVTHAPLGTLGGLVTQWGLPRALDAAGGLDNLSGQHLYDALLTMKDVDFMGNCKPVTLSPTERRGSMGVKIYQFQPDGSCKALTDWRTCPDALHKYAACAE